VGRKSALKWLLLVYLRTSSCFSLSHSTTLSVIQQHTTRNHREEDLPRVAPLAHKLSKRASQQRVHEARKTREVRAGERACIAVYIAVA
jgi:hypothetical protein